MDLNHPVPPFATAQRCTCRLQAVHFPCRQGLGLCLGGCLAGRHILDARVRATRGEAEQPHYGVVCPHRRGCSSRASDGQLTATAAVYCSWPEQARSAPATGNPRSPVGQTRAPARQYAEAQHARQRQRNFPRLPGRQLQDEELLAVTPVFSLQLKLARCEPLQSRQGGQETQEKQMKDKGR